MRKKTFSYMELVKEKLFRTAAETRLQKVRCFSTVCLPEKLAITTWFIPSGANA